MGHVGGLLFRLVADNFFLMVKDSLTDLGWFDSNRNHKPVVLRTTPVENDEAVVPNVVAFSEEDVEEIPSEMGSNLTEHRILYFIDVYAESRSIAIHLAGDIKDILEGRFYAIGRTNPNFLVRDLQQATPTPMFTAELENVVLERSRITEKPYEKFWWVVSCELVFTYSSDLDEYTD